MNVVAKDIANSQIVCAHSINVMYVLVRDNLLSVQRLSFVEKKTARVLVVVGVGEGDNN